MPQYRYELSIQKCDNEIVASINSQPICDLYVDNDPPLNTTYDFTKYVDPNSADNNLIIFCYNGASNVAVHQINPYDFAYQVNKIDIETGTKTLIGSNSLGGATNNSNTERVEIAKFSHKIVV